MEDLIVRATCGVLVRDPDGRVLLMQRSGEGTIQCVGVVFFGSPATLSEPTDGEASQLGWFPLDALPEPIFAPDIPVLRDAALSEGHPLID